MALTKIADGGMPAGSVVQVVQGSASSEVETSSATFVTSGLSASITPSSTSNKILISADVLGQTAANDARLDVTIYRDSTNLGGGDASGLGYLHAPSGTHLGMICMSILDSPSSTSSITYTVYFQSRAAVGSVKTRADVVPSKITLMEIAV